MQINTESDGETVTVSVDGELDAHNCSHLGEAIRNAVAASGQSVVIEASALRFIDSSAISELLRARQEVTDRGGALSMRNVAPSVRRVLEITGLEDTFGVS